MKKRILTMLLALIMVVSLVGGAIPALAAGETITLRLHYHREDGNYEGWQMWFWDNDGVSSLEPPYEFVEEDGEMVATIQLKPGTMQVGYIVRYGEWVEKDVDYDQYIDITGVLAGTVDFYVESGVATQASTSATPSRDEQIAAGNMKLGDDVVIGVVVTGARYKDSADKPQILVKMSSALDYDADLSTFSVFNSDGNIEIKEVKCVNSTYYLTLGQQLDLSRGYQVTFEGTTYDVTMPDYFSNDEFESLYTYDGDDLGATYTKESTTLRVWAPTAIGVSVNLYSDGDPDAQPEPISQVEMTKDVKGTWVATLDGDQNGTYYTYEVTLDNDVNEACDPYARTTGVNGERAMIIDLDSTDPEGWDTDKDPHYDDNYTDAIIWELHVRDLSSDASSGITNKGKFLGLIETGTTNSNGISTGLDHIKDLGVTHVHLLPSYDFGSVDESKLDTNPDQFNWGYDPVNYNVPEGSYSTDPYHGEVRVSEFKQMVKGLHDNGISVIMDVVYNHVYNGSKYCFNQIVPGYFTRPSGAGSGCGNDVASERSMVSKYIVDSVNYWADEYHIDGFRFDLAGVLDTDTINAVVESVHENHPNVIFYGEGWTSGSVVFTKTGYTQALMANSSKTPNFAYFSDTIRNNVKGGTYGGVTAGFISGGSVSSGDLNACFKGMPSWCSNPSQSINYVSAHDNNTLYDHITLAASGASEAERISMNKLGVAFYMTSQGIPFMQAGEEMLRSKPNGDGTYNENSYNASDAVNSLKWDDLNKAEYMDVYEYYKGLIAFRKAHPALRLTTAAEVDANVTVVNGLSANVVAYQINGGVNGETAESIFAIFNANKSSTTVTLPDGEWNICVNGDDAGTSSLGTASGSVTVNGISAMVLVKGDVATNSGSSTDTTQPTTGSTGSTQSSNDDATITALIIAIIAVVVVTAVIVVVILLKKKKQ